MTAVATLFPTAAKVVRRTGIDPELLKVEHNTPLPSSRASVQGKFHALFKQLRPGSCIRCEAVEMNALANALRKQISLGKYPAIKGCIVRSGKCEDGHARVWAVKGEQ